MHSNLYLSIEVSRRRRSDWRHFLRLGDLAAAPVLHTLLGGAEVAAIPLEDRLAPKGLPADVDARTLDEDAFTVDDEWAHSDVGDILDDMRICSTAEAERWLAAGESRWIRPGFKITDPETHSHSWMTPEELEAFILTCERHNAEYVHLLRGISACMNALAHDGFDSRIVYWFS
jgi:hypothetical protein